MITQGKKSLSSLLTTQSCLRILTTCGKQGIEPPIISGMHRLQILSIQMEFIVGLDIRARWCDGVPLVLFDLHSLQ